MNSGKEKLPPGSGGREGCAAMDRFGIGLGLDLTEQPEPKWLKRARLRRRAERACGTALLLLGAAGAALVLLQMAFMLLGKL